MAKDSIMSKSFYSHHSAWGSYSSFVLGKIGYGGGFVLNNVQPPHTNIYIGYKKGKDKPKLLPFFSDVKYGIGEEAYREVENDSTVKWCRKNANIFKESVIKRQMKWATEKWIADDLSLNIITGFGKIPEPRKMNREEKRFYFCPAVFIQLEFDNTNGKDEMIGVFAMQGTRRPLSDHSNSLLCGMANEAKYGFATLQDNDIRENVSWNIASSIFENKETISRLAFEGGLSFKIPPRRKKIYTIALAVYQDGNATTGIKTKYYYSKYFNDLEDVLYFALSNFDRYNKLAIDRDYELDASGLNEYKKFMISHFTRSYMANTQFLIDKNKKPYFVVNEGEYQLMNTLDLVVDQAFWEMNYTPWTIKNELESYKKYYSYTDYLMYNNNEKKSGEISFCHDQGIANGFTRKGYSAYERGGLTGCFSYMSHEQILNWLLTATLYGITLKDTGWLRKNFNTFLKIFNSIIIRDENGDGIMDKDSSRCEGGSEITTYDSLDASLGQARNNLYLAVKTWAGYVCLENVFKTLKKNKLMIKAEERSRLCASSIISKFDKKAGYIPAVFEKNNRSKIIPAIEGLIYPYFIQDIDAISDNGRYGDLVKILKIHLGKVLVAGSCINAKSGGWQLSSTSKNSWMSKIIINQYIAEKILKIKTKDWEKWDKIHCSWQQDGCHLFAATDQINSDNGKDMGSRLYPRLVTSILWLKH